AGQVLADGTSLTLARTLARAARRSARADDIGALKTWGYLSTRLSIFAVIEMQEAGILEV
ncbi:hypothetical protein, partial [Xanthomonas oryzae]|uniref:hypothetical protein n=1 Tax=Xanthomonas oryzae TaxID=347 RepID=UPI002DF3513C|nr:hypothetical protein [Xanthomonas oryzae pv. oryzicola]